MGPIQAAGRARATRRQTRACSATRTRELLRQSNAPAALSVVELLASTIPTAQNDVAIRPSTTRVKSLAARKETQCPTCLTLEAPLISLRFNRHLNFEATEWLRLRKHYSRAVERTLGWKLKRSPIPCSSLILPLPLVSRSRRVMHLCQSNQSNQLNQSNQQSPRCIAGSSFRFWSYVFASYETHRAPPASWKCACQAASSSNLSFTSPAADTFIHYHRPSQSDMIPLHWKSFSHCYSHPLSRYCFHLGCYCHCQLLIPTSCCWCRTQRS